MNFTLEKAHLSKKIPIVLSKETTTFVQQKSWGLLLHVLKKNKSVESKATAYFWQIYYTSGCPWRSDTIRPCLPFFFSFTPNPSPKNLKIWSLIPSDTVKSPGFFKPRGTHKGPKQNSLKSLQWKHTWWSELLLLLLFLMCFLFLFCVYFHFFVYLKKEANM